MSVCVLLCITAEGVVGGAHVLFADMEKLQENIVS